MLRYFIRPWTGFQILIGPDAEKEGDEYTHCIPLRDTGEFGGYSNTPLTTRVKRKAIEAALTLGFTDPYWGRLKKEKAMKMTVTITVENDPGEAAHQHEIFIPGKQYLAFWIAGDHEINRHRNVRLWRC